MQILKQFWYQFVASITNVSFYLQLFRHPGKLVIAYYYAATLLLALISAAWLHFVLLPQFTTHATNVRNELVASFPEDRAISIMTNQIELQALDASGAASIARNELRIPSPPSLTKLFMIPTSQLAAWHEQWPENLLIVVPSPITSAETYLNSIETTSLVVLDPKTAYVFDGESWEESPLTQLKASNTKITSQEIRNLSNTVSNQVESVVKKYLFLVWPVLIILTLINQTILLLWYALLTLFVSKVFSYQLGYLQCMKITAYIIILAQIVSMTTQAIYPWFGLDMLSISFWAICLYVFYVLRSVMPKKPQLPSKPTT